MQKLEIMSQALIRHPLRPDKQIDSEQDVLNFFQNHFAQEALFTSSPSLYREYKKWENGELDQKRRGRLIISLYRYFQRIHKRCTPFGLLAAVAPIGYKPRQANLISSIDRKTSLDSVCIDQLISLIQKEKEVTEQLHYRVNTSIYKFKDQYRYLKVLAKVEGDEVELCSINADPIMDELVEFGREFRHFSDLLNSISHISSNKEERRSFIQNLIHHHILLSELNISLSDTDQLCLIIKKLKKAAERSPNNKRLVFWITKLTQLQLRLIRLDKRIVNRTSAYQAIFKFLKNLGVDLNPKYIFQIDTKSRIENSSEDGCSELKELNLMKVIRLLYSKSRMKDNRLKEFVENFNRRYGDKTVPLMEVLDPDIGIGYGLNKNGSSIPLEKLGIENTIAFGEELNDHLNGNNTEILSYRDKNVGDYSIELPEELMNAKNTSLANMPNTFSIKVSAVIDEKENSMYLIKDIGGAHGLHYLSRFCYLDKNIEAIAKEIASFERSSNPGKRLVEFYHRSHLRSCNINQRPNLYNASISYIDASEKRDVGIENICLQIRNDCVELYDRRTGVEIIPRISSAHDFRVNTLPLYHFMGELQTQRSLDHLQLENGEESVLGFFPRISYKNIIVRPAKWVFHKNQLKSVLNNEKEFLKWMSKWEIPAFIQLNEGDRELILKLNRELDRKVLLDELRHRTLISFREYFKPDPNFLRDSEGRYFANEILLFVKNHKKTKNQEINLLPLKSRDPVSDNNCADQWIYFKLYCNQSKANQVLLRLGSFISEFKRKKLIVSWFFVRYRDPDHHIRIRFKLFDLNDRALLIDQMIRLIDVLKDETLLWKYQLDTYQAELNRYGADIIQEVEEIFHIDSEACLRLIQLGKFNILENQWQVGLMFVHELFELFDLLIEERIDLLVELNESFKREFFGEKKFNKLLSNNYRNKREQINCLLSNVSRKNEDELCLIGVTAERSIKINLKLKEFNRLTAARKQDLMLNLMHMSMNRLFFATPRFQEFLVYDLLWNNYRAHLAKAAKTTTSAQ